MSIAVKICGVTSEDIAQEAIAAGASYIGLVHFPPSPRHLDIAAMAKLRTRIPFDIKTVVVLVDADDTLLKDIAAQVRPDFFQLHGSESPHRVMEVKQLTGKPVIKAITIGNQHDFAITADYEEAANMLLFDAKAPAGTLPGGRGESFDWSLLKNNWYNLPWFLSGGLNADNVALALEQSGAQMVDVSSGVETAPGVKSAEKIHQFIQAAQKVSA